MTSAYKIPRLYTNAALGAGQDIALDQDQTHYIRNVMRMDIGASLRLFNAQNGEWRGEITAITKKQTTLKLTEQLKTQPVKSADIHLLFAPIKKQRLDFLIEKAVELGVTHLTPVLTDHTENRNIKPDRLNAQIIEAAEQCERLTLPTLEDAASLKQIIATWPNQNPETPILWCAEREGNAPHLRDIKTPQAFLIGPEGGFSDNECAYLKKCPHITPIHLGEQILRAETAALFCLSHI